MGYVDDMSDRLKIDIKNWPHQFTKDGDPVQIGKEDLTGDPIMVAPMMCVHCGIKFVTGQTSRPPDPCPARNQKREMKRILG